MVDREKVVDNLTGLNEMLKLQKDIKGYGFYIDFINDALALLKEQEGLMLALEQSNAANEYLNAEVERLNGLLKEQEEIIEQYRRADGFLAAHGWKWEGR